MAARAGSGRECPRRDWYRSPALLFALFLWLFGTAGGAWASPSDACPETDAIPPPRGDSDDGDAGDAGAPRTLAMPTTGYYGSARIVLRVDRAEAEEGVVKLKGKVLKIYENEPGLVGDRGLSKGDIIEVYFFPRGEGSESLDIGAGDLVMMRIAAVAPGDSYPWVGDDTDIRTMNPVLFYIGYYGPILLAVILAAFAATIAWWLVKRRRKARGVVPMDPGRERGLGASYRCGTCDAPLRLLAREGKWYCDNCRDTVDLVTGPREPPRRYRGP